ncbi:hypothetical protein AB0H94_11435 [Streptomyces purpurascens]|uniref:hypothetical protein n=1 Tax=Streptomyces purpurascens TaxID=1924 RepID=UPI0033E5EE2A
MTSAKSVTAAVRKAGEPTGGIDVLVNNAGVSLDGELRPPYLDEDILPARSEGGRGPPAWLATLPEGDGTTGGLFADRRPLPW